MSGSSAPEAIRDPRRLSELRSLELLDTPAEEPFDCFTRLAARFLDVPIALFSLVDEDRQFFKSQVGLPEPWAAARETPLSHSFCQHAVASGEPLIVEDARRDPLLRDNLAIPDLGVVAYAGIPLTTPDGQTLGTFCAIDSKPHRWTEDEIRVLQDLASGVMTEVGLRRDLSLRRRAEALLAAEKRVLEAISTGAALNDVLHLLAREIERQSDGGLCSILLLDPERSELRFAAAPNLLESFVREVDGMRVGEGRGGCGTAAYRNEPVMVREIQSDPVWKEYRELAREHGLAASWSHPIRAADGAVLGIFAIYFREPHDPAPAEREVVDRAAHLASIAVERSRTEDARRESEQQARRMAERMHAVAAAAAGVLGAHSLEELDAVLRRTAEGVLPHDVLTFATYDPDEQALEFVAGWDGDLWVPGERLPLDGTPSERVIRQRQSLLTLRSDDEAAAGAAVFGTGRRSESVIRAPILGSERVLGVLSVQSYTPDLYTHDDVQVLEAFASVAATAIENIELLNAVRTREAHYRRLVDTSPMGIYAVDRDGICTEANPALGALLQRPAAELLGRAFTDFTAPEDLETAGAIFRPHMPGEREGDSVEVRLLRPSGERRLVEAYSTVVRDGSAVVGAHGLLRDVTEEREHEAQMRLFAAALERLDEGVSVIDEEGRLLYSNAAHSRALGYPPGRAPAEGIWSFIPDQEARDQVRQIREQVGLHGTWSGVVRRRRTDGRIIPMEMRVQQVEQNGRSLLFTITRDITEQIEQEQRLRRAERLASLGTLVGGVAHELNNPLHAIRGFAQILLAEETSPERREDLETINRETERMAKIVSDLRLVARETQEKELPRGPVDLNDVVRHVLRTREYVLSTRSVEVRQDLAPGLPPVWGNRGQLEQVVLNLVVNAEQAMATQERSRRLILRTRSSGKGSSLQVVDTGSGIAQEHLQKIFDPFWTTKPTGEGTGLGLSLVHGIVADHAGDIQVDSQVGEGTAFRIDLPAAPHTAATKGAAVEAAETRGLRVLVVDDESANRRVLARLLHRRGHQVEEAPDGSAALEMIGDTEYDVIISDLRMPGLGGEELLRRLQQQGRGLERRLMFLTGDAASAQARRVIDEVGIPVLLKPFDPGEIAFTVERFAERAP